MAIKVMRYEVYYGELIDYRINKWLSSSITDEIDGKKEKTNMFNGNYSKVMSPCLGCANRCVGCHSQCAKYRKFEENKAKEEYERVKSHEGLDGVVVRLSAVIG